MSNVERSLDGFKFRIGKTFLFSVSPFYMLYLLLTRLNNEVSTPAPIFVGILTSPLLIGVGFITLGLGVIAASVQSLFLPVQLLFSKIQDSSSSSIEGDKEISKGPETSSVLEVKKDPQKDENPANHPRLFTPPKTLQKHKSALNPSLYDNDLFWEEVYKEKLQDLVHKVLDENFETSDREIIRDNIGNAYEFMKTEDFLSAINQYADRAEAEKIQEIMMECLTESPRATMNF
ncbi:hypothetical protein DM455_03455 [Legionella pneumophila]|uniref:hypothetical protein n=1 Tax=Legionella pneumophila TaxID=446 RepID=UPI000D7BC535|nr:hypothetical protein [Legionella pneumophila]PYB45891.1 hypothetical protein DM454_04515 [Legionella pneumophila]PYB52986.1 hypothetical protein DM456_04030 [Legionella pneumophila]PYB64545.1 hypothetical protein DM455_03455 [Legionella pneumophila]TID60669.1 hypothetical protein DIZ38_06655 [Legionella pneumophila]TID61495.1 hypothetical protein DIZ40_04455 [Legionella pneumophila]